jgi:NADH dehydrogenase
VDSSPTHLWKPLLHEVAAGTLDSHEDEIEYLAQAAWSHFRYRRGYMDGLDRERGEISIAPMFNEKGAEIVPRRTLPYDTLVMAVGSVSNDFGVPGVKEHCLFLDNTDQAEHFQRQLFESLLVHGQSRASARGDLDIAIVGGGATGIELAAQLHEISHLLYAYGLEEVEPANVKITVIEAASRLLPGLPAEISRATERQLTRLGIEVHTGERVVEVDAHGFRTHGGRQIPADIKVWAAGIKASDFLKDLGGLETNKLNQLIVTQTLQTTRDAHVFALGDCAACPWPGQNSAGQPA